MFDLQTLIAVLATLLLFLTSVVLAYDTLQFRNYDLPIPQWFGLSLAGVTFGLLLADQLLRGFVRLEEKQRRAREENFRIEAEQRRISEARSREGEATRAEAERLEAREYRARAENFRIEEAERQARRTRIETRYRIALGQFQLDPSAAHREEFMNVLALLREYQDTL
ncbi:MAG: hypothetical protein VKN60_10170 [Cyanobacteriota bacterium]|nr:hypothetical protein [Cyanobacteriota bacterium]